jgi:hypothetical protein
MDTSSTDTRANAPGAIESGGTPRLPFSTPTLWNFSYTFSANVVTILADCAAIAAVSVPAAAYARDVAEGMRNNLLVLLVIIALELTVIVPPIWFLNLLQNVVQNEFMYYRFMQHGLLLDYGGRKPRSMLRLLELVIVLVASLLVLFLVQLATGRIGEWDFVARAGAVGALGVALSYRVRTDLDIESRLLPIGSLVRNDMKAAMEFIGSLKICSDRALVPYTAYATIMAEVHAKEKLPNLEVPLLTIQTMLENAGMDVVPPEEVERHLLATGLRERDAKTYTKNYEGYISRDSLLEFKWAKHVHSATPEHQEFKDRIFTLFSGSFCIVMAVAIMIFLHYSTEVGF